MDTRKMDNLMARLRDMPSAVLAFSGGLDSAVLLMALARSGIRALVITGQSPTTPAHDLKDAKRIAAIAGVNHRFIDTKETEDERFMANPTERCYFCKDELFTKITAIADAEGYAHVLDGSNLDDLSDHRPGLKAAKAHGVLSPLAIECFTKADIRAAARSMNLDIADKPASPCLSSRFPYGVRITPQGLARVAQAEDYLRNLGFDNLRVRDNNAEARIEVPQEDMERLFAIRADVVRTLMSLGYKYVALDLEGLISGKLNRIGE